MSDPWVKFYSSDWLAGTSGLTAAERGVYITLVAMMYEADGPLKLDRTRLARRCGIPSGSFKRILEALIDEGKILETPDGLINRKAEKEMGDRKKRHTKHQSGARKTNAIRAEKSQQNQQKAERTASRSAIREPEPEPEPEKKDTYVSEKKKTQSASHRGSRLPDDWRLPKPWGDWAVKQGLSVDQVRATADEFRDYWISATGRNATKANWEATWRNWIRKNLRDRPAAKPVEENNFWFSGQG